MVEQSSLSGLLGVADMVRDSVRELAKLDDLVLAQEGMTLLDRWKVAQHLPPGDHERTNVGGLLGAFKLRALRRLAELKGYR